MDFFQSDYDILINALARHITAGFRSFGTILHNFKSHLAVFVGFISILSFRLKFHFLLYKPTPKVFKSQPDLNDLND